MTLLGEPQHDQAVKQHRQRRRPLDRSAGPALRLLKAERLLAVMERDFDLPIIVPPKITL